MDISIWWAIPAFVALVGFLSLLGGLGRVFQLKIFTGLSRLVFGGVTMALAAVLSLAGLNLQTYARLTHEQVAAEVTLDEKSPGVMSASVRKALKGGGYGEPETFDLQGDAFRVEARILKWKPWANITGADTLYRLERIQGRHDTVEAENAAPPTAYNLADAAGVDVFEFARNQGKVINAVDAYYGGGTYAPMADGAVYEIMVTQSSLIARPKNDIAAIAVGKWGQLETPPEPSGRKAEPAAEPAVPAAAPAEPAPAPAPPG